MPDSAQLAACTLVPAAVTAVTLAWAVRGRSASLLDRPNPRSLHTVPTPRLGGLAIAIGLIAAALAWGEPPGWAPAWMLLVLVSLVDDYRSLPVSVRLLTHLVAIGWLMYDLELTLPAGAAVVVAAAAVWMTNLYNFMDGADGLAGGMAVFGFGALAAGAGSAAGLDAAWMALAVVCAALGFLLFNFPPARVFLGDAGSVPLGFLAATMALSGWASGWWSGWFAALAFLPFIADASLTLLRRAFRGERVWQAHREHFYQRLVRSGWTHRRTALAYYALMLGCAGTALVALLEAPQALPAATIGWCAILATFFAWVERRFRRRDSETARG